MASPLVAAYSYPAPSRLAAAPQGDEVLQLATSGGVALLPDGTSEAVEHPFFFSGFAEHPRVLAQGLLLLARVARTRFYTPPGMLARILRAADPVLTSSPGGLRMESFSACNGVYARLDIGADALDAQHSGSGVTNVDVNPPLRAALTALRRQEPLHLGIGGDGLVVTTLDARVTEERVDLPERWVRGFGETQLISSRLARRLELTAAEARQLIGLIPRTVSPRSVQWVTPSMRGVRPASRSAPGSVRVAAAARLRVLEPLLPLATGLRAFGEDPSLPDTASGWVLDLPGARLTLLLSGDASRGFSGEGGLLGALGAPPSREGAAAVRIALGDGLLLTPASLAARSGLPAAELEPVLAALAADGQIGHDLHAGASFPRPLPWGAEGETAAPPRLAGARELVAAGAVRRDGDRVIVASGDTEYVIRLSPSGIAGASCTCPWFGRHQGTRGPCKHILAAEISHA